MPVGSLHGGKLGHCRHWRHWLLDDENHCMHYLFLLLVILMPFSASGAGRASPAQWVWFTADASNPTRTSLPGVALDPDARRAFVDSRPYVIGNRRFRLIYHVFDSRASNPMGFCGAGREIYLSVYDVSQPVPVERIRTLVSSCLQSLLLASQEAGCPDSESDFSSVVLLGDELTISWAGTRQGGAFKRRYLIRNGHFFLQATTAEAE